MPIHKTRLDNGVRVLIEPNDHVHSAAIGLWCKTGSRHETDEEAGLTHFIEHMLFKGTATRTAKQIAEEIEGRGGVLNAFTDKEQTCYYCRVLDEDVPIAVDLLTDMVRHSLLEPEELEREKGVVLEEIKRSEDEPSDLVHEIHLSGRWGKHPLGKPVIGTKESVSSFTRENILSYLERRYRPDTLVLAIAGNVDPDETVRQAESLLGDLEGEAGDGDLPRPVGNAGKNEVRKDVEQVHFCIGTDGCAVYDEELHTAAVLDGVLGGGMSSRLFQEVREKRGLAYAIGSYTLSYAHGGAFTVYGGTGRKTWGQVQEVVRQELDRVMSGDVSEEELNRIKRNISGNMVLALEGMSARMMRMAKNELYHQRHVPLEETLSKIDAVTHEKLTDYAKKVLSEERISTTAIGPF